MTETDSTVGEEEDEVESCVSSEVGHSTEITLETIEGFIYVFLFKEDDDFCNVYDDDSEDEETYTNRTGYSHMDSSQINIYECDHIPEAMSALNAIEELLINGLSGVVEE